jgi:hypothetical protein
MAVPEWVGKGQGDIVKTIKEASSNSAVERRVSRLYVLGGYEGHDLTKLAKALAEDATEQGRTEDLKVILKEAMRLIGG